MTFAFAQRAPETVASLESVRLTGPHDHASVGTLLYAAQRRPGNKEVVTADVQFRRTEQLRVDAPSPTVDQQRSVYWTGRKAGPHPAFEFYVRRH
jgi:hypothetical protein